MTLTDAQFVLLSAAAQHEEHLIGRSQPPRQAAPPDKPVQRR